MNHIYSKTNNYQYKRCFSNEILGSYVKEIASAFSILKFMCNS